MCGIAGILNLTDRPAPAERELERMIKMLRHRGPDDYGYYRDDRVGLAHARLSIIDLESGHQPIHDETKDVWIVFNGEIFNYIELREQLLKDGFSFYTHSDTEVIVHLYVKYGLDFVNHLNGQFALALWDKKRHKLILARDRVGILPLFYSREGQRLVFASEVKSLLPVMRKAPALNPHALDQLFTFWSPVTPGTLFEHVHEVKPGEMTVVEDGVVSHHRYWEWEFPADGVESYLPGSEGELADELHDRLVEATRLRLRSDVPVAAYLSGGLDSSSLVSIIHHHGDVPLRTFSIGFEDKNLDESSYQQQLIRHLGAKHSSILCATGDIANHFERAVWHIESAILRAAPVPMMLLSGLVQQHGYKVVLTGEGADEVFGGYDIFKEGKIRGFWARNANSNFRPLLLKRLYPYLDITQKSSRAYLQNFFGIGLEQPEVPYFAHLPRWDTTSKIKMFYSDDFKARLSEDAIDRIGQSLHENIQSWHPFNRSQYIEARSLMARYLLCSQGDRMLMSNSVEGRYPFLDHNVIEFANKLPPKLKMKVLNEKYLLKKAMQQYLPNEIVNRPKQPYRAPDIPAFINDRTKDFVHDLLAEGSIRDAGYFDARKIAVLLKKINAGRAIGYKDNMAFMAVLSTQMWHHLFVRNFVAASRG